MKKQNRTQIISLRISQKEYKLLKKESKKQHLGQVSTMVRDVVLKEVTLQKGKPNTKKVIRRKRR